MSKKLIVGFIVFLILLLGMTVVFVLKGGANYFSYKSYLKSIQEDELNKPSNNVDIGNKSSQGTSSNELDNSGITNPGNSSNAEIGDNKASTNTPNTTPDNLNTSNEKNEETYDNINFTRNLKNGAVGDDVKKLQYLLKKMNLYNANIDGIFGSATYKAVINYQKNNNLLVDGIAGPNTFSKLLE